MSGVYHIHNSEKENDREVFVNLFAFSNLRYTNKFNLHKLFALCYYVKYGKEKFYLCRSYFILVFSHVYILQYIIFYIFLFKM